MEAFPLATAPRIFIKRTAEPGDQSDVVALTGMNATNSSLGTPRSAVRKANGELIGPAAYTLGMRGKIVVKRNLTF
jgi:hypothetical protein